MSLLHEIQNDVTRSGTYGEIPNLLRKCKRLAARLGSDVFAQWVNCELDGYQETQAIPGYRRLTGNCYANFMGRGWRANHQMVPLFAVPEEFQDDLYSMEFRGGIAKVVSFVEKGAMIEQPHIAVLVKRQGQMFPQLQCIGAWKEISGSQFEQLISAIKNRVLDFAIAIESENPNAGEAPLNSQPVPAERLQTLVNNFFAPVGNVAQHGQNSSQTANIGIQSSDLARLVVELTEHLDELALDGPQRKREQRLSLPP
jgi:hypothetical protein